MIWLRRRPKNRTHHRRQVLDVKLSSEQKQSTRIRWFGVAFGAAAVAMLVLFGIWRGGDWAMQQFIYRNSAFAVRDIQVETDGVIAPDQIRRWAGVRLDENLFSLSLDRIKRDLECVPVVRLAEVERILPHTLRIQISEREPVAQFIFAQPRLGGSPDQVTYTLDEEGFVMPQITTYQRSIPSSMHEILPTVVGVSPTEIRPGRKVEAPQVLAALKFLDAFERSPMAGLVDVREVHAGHPDILLVSTEQRAQVVFGLRHPEPQLMRWRSIYDYGQQRGLHVATTDLSVANNVPARWLEASEAALVKPKAARPGRSKKRNV